MTLPLILFHNQGRGKPVGGGGGTPYSEKVLGIETDDLIGYWQMNEPSGGTATDSSAEGNNGAYGNVTLGQPGIGDGNTCPRFNGSNSVNNVDSGGFRSDFDGQEGTFAVWVKVFNAAVWTDGDEHDFFWNQVDGSNYAWIRKHTTNNRLEWVQNSGGTFLSVVLNGVSNLDWFHVALTWSLSGDKLIAYYNGLPAAAAETGLGSWAGDPIVNVIGQTSDSLDGWMAHPAWWKTPLSAGDIASLAVV